MPIEIIDGHPIQGTLRAQRLVCDGAGAGHEPRGRVRQFYRLTDPLQRHSITLNDHGCGHARVGWRSEI